MSDIQVYTDNAPPMPERKRGSGGARPEKWPFSSLEVGSYFLIPATPERPDPWLSYQSTVSGAQRRFAEESDETVERKNKAGETVTRKKLIHTRKFAIYRAELQDGSAVAVVKRTA